MIDLIEETCEFIFHCGYELTFVLVIGGVVNFGEAVIDFLVPVHIQFFFIEDALVSEGHEELHWHASSVSILHFIEGTLIIPVFSLFLSTAEADPMRWP